MKIIPAAAFHQSQEKKSRKVQDRSAWVGMRMKNEFKMENVCKLSLISSWNQNIFFVKLIQFHKNFFFGKLNQFHKNFFSGNQFHEKFITD